MKILIVLMLFCLSAMAGHESGNGGDGIYCPENSKVTLLDYYEQSHF